MAAKGDDYADDIVQDDVPKHLERRKKEFQPWHKVRKQFIRQKQWNDITEDMITGSWAEYFGIPKMTTNPAASAKPTNPSSSFRTDRPLNCLVIPGDDLLDIRSLYSRVAPHECYIQYLGFNMSGGSDKVGTDLHIANNAVTSLHGISKRSQVIHDRFEALGSTQPLALKYLRDFGPFQLVNLDFCGSICPSASLAHKAYFAAIHRLLAYQFEKQTLDWLLFVTTEVEPPAIDPSEFQILCEKTKENCKENPEFLAKLKSVIPESAIDAASASVNIASLSDPQVIALFGVSIGKWMLDLCRQARPQWNLFMRSSFRYSINTEKRATMLSYAFEFKRLTVPPFDGGGVSALTLPNKNPTDEKIIAIKLIDKVASIKDVDEILRADNSLFESLKFEKMALLASADYDGAAYQEWVDKGETQSPH